MSERKLTWDSAGQRWKKIYRGKPFYGERGVKKSDSNAYRLALESYDEWRLDIDKKLNESKPFREQYDFAISMRRKMADWCLLEGESEEYNRLVKEIDRLNADFSKVKPPELNKPGAMPIDPLHTAREHIVWSERLGGLMAYRQWTGATEHAKTIDANIDEYIGVKKSGSQSGQLTEGWVNVLEHRLTYFRNFAGQLAITAINGKLLDSFRQDLLGKVEKKEIALATAGGILTITKTFIRWLWEIEALENMPRNIGKLTIETPAVVIRTMPADEIKLLLAGAIGRTKLFLMLMLNCGMTQKDIADLKPREIDLTAGRISRKRSKTATNENVPKVTYKLWSETLTLLRQFTHKTGKTATSVFVNENGESLRRRGYREDGKARNIDNVRSAIYRLCKRLKREMFPPKLLRKTGATMLGGHDVYGRYAQYYLGHAPRSVADKHYVKPSQEQFDSAITWLGEQYGIK